MRSKHLTRFLQLRCHGEMGHHETRKGFAFARVQEHVEELRRFFDLPLDELFLDEFYCALYKRILLQGRMYIFEHYVCFYSNVFGWVKRKVIPLREVTEVTKKRNYGFPNSIEVVWKKKEFFTSFLNRTTAFQLLCEAVTYVREISSPPSSLDTNSSGGLPYHNTHQHQHGRESESSGQSSGTDHHQQGGGEADEDSDLEEYDEDFEVWTVIPGEAPAIPENMELLCEDHYDVTVQEFFHRTLSLESVFLSDYHARRGDTRYSVSQWEQLHEISGSVRQATFVSPVKGVRGIAFIRPKSTVCNQDHRLGIYDGNHLVFEISQVMKDIPYGDNFSVEIRWDVRPEEGTTGCSISIHVAVPFIRSVMAPFRALIESNVMKEMQESVRIMTEMLKTIMTSIEDDNSSSEEGQNENKNEEGQNGKKRKNKRSNSNDHSFLIHQSDTLLSSQAFAKLKNVLAEEEGVRKLDQWLNSAENIVERESSSGYDKDKISPSLHQNTTTMNIQAPVMNTTNWILFLCCFLMLFCQILLVVLWMSPTGPAIQVSGQNQLQQHLHNIQSPSDADGLEVPYAKMLHMEQMLTTLSETLNKTELCNAGVS